MSLNINKLRNDVVEREKTKINTFEKVLDICFKKILHSNQNYSDYCCTFDVPKFVFGLPLYNIIECCGFIIEKLIEKGFEVYLAVPTTLHISWKPKEKEKDKDNNYNNNNKLQIQYDIKKQNNNPNYNPNYNPNNSIDISSNKQIAIKSRNGIQYDIKNQNNNNSQYRSIDDYKQNTTNIYDSNDLDLFRNKLDNLFD